MATSTLPSIEKCREALARLEAQVKQLKADIQRLGVKVADEDEEARRPGRLKSTTMDFNHRQRTLAQQRELFKAWGYDL